MHERLYLQVLDEQREPERQSLSGLLFADLWRNGEQREPERQSLSGLLIRATETLFLSETISRRSQKTMVKTVKNVEICKFFLRN